MVAYYEHLAETQKPRGGEMDYRKNISRENVAEKSLDFLFCAPLTGCVRKTQNPLGPVAGRFVLSGTSARKLFSYGLHKIHCTNELQQQLTPVDKAFTPHVPDPSEEGSSMGRIFATRYTNLKLYEERRTERFKLAKWKCEVCGYSAEEIHHLDRNKSNHAIENLVSVCRDCHLSKYHPKPLPKITTKYIRLYGHTRAELARLYDVSDKTILDWHKKKILKPFLKTQEAIA